MGRPGVPWTSPEHLAELIEEYFQSRWHTRTIRQHANGVMTEIEEEYMRPPTMAGLAIALGTTRTTLVNYKHKDEFASTLAHALMRVAEFAEEALYTREGGTGARFALEVNHKYGKETGGDGGVEFIQNVITPAIDHKQALAIPKWEEPEK